MSDVEVLLTVGKLDASLALLTTQDHHVIEFPTMLLPDNVKAGSIVKLSVSQNLEEEKRQFRLFRDIQTKILEKYGIEKPKAPILKIVNVTQTSCVLAWDPLSLGSARLKSLILYRQGVRSMVIPSPLKTIMTKISGLSIDTDYEFQLKLSTTSGQYWSQRVKMHTHKMTDMSGITVCLGSLDPSQNISGEQIAESLKKVGARSMQKHTAIDTTHFVTNDLDNEDDPELLRAKSSNIPIVRPEWVRACEVEKRIVGVRGFYLDADPGILKSYQFPKISGSKVKFVNETETIGDKEQEVEKEVEVEKEPESEENSKQNDEHPRSNEDPKKDGAEVNPESAQEGVGQDKLKEADEATTETTMELNDEALQSDLNISGSKKDEESALTQEAIDKDIESGTTELHKKPEGPSISVEPDSKAQEEEHIESKLDSSEVNGAIKSTETRTLPDSEKGQENGEETLEVTSEDNKDEISQLEKVDEPPTPVQTSVTEGGPDSEQGTVADGSTETKDKIPEENVAVAISASEKDLNAKEETAAITSEDIKDEINELEKVDEPPTPIQAPVTEEGLDSEQRTVADGSMENKDKIPDENGVVAISASEKVLNTKEETPAVASEDNKDEISEQEKGGEPLIPVTEEGPNSEQGTVADGSAETKDKIPEGNGVVAISASEKDLNTKEETPAVASEDNKDEISEQEKGGEPLIPVTEEGPNSEQGTVADGSAETKDKIPEENVAVAISSSEKDLNAKEETPAITSEDIKDEINELEKIDEPSIPVQVPGTEREPDGEQGTFADGSMENKDKIPDENGEVATFASEKELNSGEEDKPRDTNTDVLESNGEKLDAENKGADKEQDFAEVKPEETKDLDGSKVSSSETKPDEVGENHPVETGNQEKEVESHIGEPAETNSFQAHDGSQDTEAKDRESTPESSSSHPKSAGSSKKHKKKNKNKKK